MGDGRHALHGVVQVHEADVVAAVVAGVVRVDEEHVRRIQIRETVKSHIEKERIMFSKGIKVLSLFFIDEVVKYRDYDQADEKGEYAHIFEEEYKKAVEIKMDTIYFYIKHKNSGEIVRCSAYTGPRKFKELIESWVDSIINPSTDSSIA